MERAAIMTSHILSAFGAKNVDYRKLMPRPRTRGSEPAKTRAEAQAELDSLKAEMGVTE